MCSPGGGQVGHRLIPKEGEPSLHKEEEARSHRLPKTSADLAAGPPQIRLSEVSGTAELASSGADSKNDDFPEGCSPLVVALCGLRVFAAVVSAFQRGRQLGTRILLCDRREEGGAHWGRAGDAGLNGSGTRGTPCPLGSQLQVK